MMADKSPERGQYKSVEVNDLQRQLRESEARYRSLVAALAQMVWIVDAEGLWSARWKPGMLIPGSTASG
ncbi:hypothetical protein KSC_049590 [Ktedonobacter sp. SOSP1-52]|uniref:hypothetical protein n=1 Tax=Ktedonobacter sp. SOSP1-52 TaxID=2778366 RepID=UPI0019151C51|nr:hypothetical protein [Ktedonobacter sp. SOSP1-52]GHO66067.1 hypothetical protein KSC_049590 [Ktedonobacter sp. SOSP1-52]